VVPCVEENVGQSTGFGGFYGVEFFCLGFMSEDEFFVQDGEETFLHNGRGDVICEIYIPQTTILNSCFIGNLVEGDIFNLLDVCCHG